MKPLDRFMSLLGYVPAPAKPIPVICTLKLNFDYDRASLDAVIARVSDLMKSERMIAELQQAQDNFKRAMAAATAAMQRAHQPLPAAAQFATAELVADETQPLILAELRKQTTLLEVLAKQGDQVALTLRRISVDSSGLPG